MLSLIFNMTFFFPKKIFTHQLAFCTGNSGNTQPSPRHFYDHFLDGAVEP